MYSRKEGDAENFNPRIQRVKTRIVAGVTSRYSEKMPSKSLVPDATPMTSVCLFGARIKWHLLLTLEQQSYIWTERPCTHANVDRVF